MFFLRIFPFSCHSLNWKNPSLVTPRVYSCLLNVKLISQNLPSNLFGTPVSSPLFVLASVSEWFGLQVVEQLTRNGWNNKVVLLMQVGSPEAGSSRAGSGHNDTTEDPNSFYAPSSACLSDSYLGLYPLGYMIAVVFPADFLQVLLPTVGHWRRLEQWGCGTSRL